MKLIARALIGFSTLLLSCSSTTHSSEDDPEKAVNRVVRAFAKKMNKYDLNFIGDGAIMPHGRIERLVVDFMYYGHCDIEKARMLEVIATNEFIDDINKDNELRKYLIEFPFKRDRGSVTISMRAQTGKWPLDGSVAFVCPAKEDDISYASAILEPVTYTNCNPDGTVNAAEPTIIVEQSKLVDLHREPFEEALRIVQSSEKSRS